MSTQPSEEFQLKVLSLFDQVFKQLDKQDQAIERLQHEVSDGVQIASTLVDKVGELDTKVTASLERLDNHKERIATIEQPHFR